MSTDADKHELTGSAVEVIEGTISTKEEHAAHEDGHVEKEPVYQLTVILPAGQTPRTVTIFASPQESPADLRQNLISHPATHHLTNYHFDYEGKPLNEYLELSAVTHLPLVASLSIVQDSYNERTMRAHFLRIKELIAPPGTGTKGIGEEWGVAGGSTLADHVLNTTSPSSAELTEYFSQPLPPLISVLAPQKDCSTSSPVKSLLLSQWNPPPPHRRTQGDLLYITFTSLEGDLYHITGNIQGFFVSRSTNQKFDPTSKNPQKLPHHSLLLLLQSLSPQFSKAFAASHPTDTNAEILSDAALANALPAFPWLVQPPQTLPDSTRTQRPWLESFAEQQANLRDWNDEIQSTRSLPSKGVRERLIRERLLQKSLADFSACATLAAMLVRRGELVPLDPVPETHEHGCEHDNAAGTMWHYNNIFLSLGAEDVLGSFASEGGGEASRVAVGKDVTGVARVNALLLESNDTDDKPETEICTLGTVVVDYLGERLVAQSVVPGIFQQTPESKDEDGAAAGAHRIVYGGVDNGEKIFADEEFDSKFEKLMEKLHVKRHDVWEVPKKHPDVNGVNGGTVERKKRTLCTSLETKGLRGADGRRYVLDLYKLTPLDITWVEEHFSDGENAYPHRMTFLRSECINAFWESKLRSYITTKLADRQKLEDQEKDTEKIDISGFDFALNPDVFTPSQAPVTEEEKRQVCQDEEDVRACCTYLREKLIPDLMKELTDGSGGWPVDGKSLTSIMHRNGVNIRYLGKVIELCGEQVKLKAVKDVALHEMVSRAAKHVFSRHLRKLHLLDVSSCVAHLLNCLMGFKLNSAPQVDLSYENEMSNLPRPEWTDLDPSAMKAQISHEIYKRYRFQLEKDWWDVYKPIVLLREICLKMGFQMKAREYTFHKREREIGSNGSAKSKKSANGTNGHDAQELTFYPEDILNVVPIIKEAPLKSALAEEVLEAGKTALFQGQKQLGLELLAESLSLHEQIYGVLHPDVARGYSKLSLIYNQMEEMRETACDLARKAVVVAERTLGLDNQETILNWLNWALCEHSRGETNRALGFIIYVLNIWRNLFGEGHPDEITMMNNVAVMLQNLREYQTSLPWFEKAYNLCSHLYGKESLNTATISFQYSQALALAQDPISAVPKMQDAYNVFAKELGPEDRSTKEAEFLLQHFTTSAVNAAKQAKSGKKPSAPNVKVTATVKPVGPEMNGIGSRGSDNIDDLVQYIGAVNVASKGRKVEQKKKRGGKR